MSKPKTKTELYSGIAKTLKNLTKRFIFSS